MSKGAKFVEFLEEACATVRDMEAKAAACIDAGDTPGYVRIMREKATFLAGLAEAGEGVAAELHSDSALQLLQRLQRFSASAGQALRLDSTFYMSALLFPEDYKPGQANDLEMFTAEVRRRLAQHPK